MHAMRSLFVVHVHCKNKVRLFLLREASGETGLPVQATRKPGPIFAQELHMQAMVSYVLPDAKGFQRGILRVQSYASFAHVRP